MIKDKLKCVDVEELSAYIDAELNRSRQAEIAVHLDTCAQCQHAETLLRGLKVSLSACRDERPKRDLWPEIDRQVSAEKGAATLLGSWFPRWWPVPIAAAVAALLLVLFYRQPVEPPAEHPDRLALNQAFVTAQQAELAYRDAILSLEQALEQEKPSLDPQTRRIVEQSLAEIEGAIERCRAAMLENPDNAETHRAMLAAYREKMDFLFELVGSRTRPGGA